MKKSCDLCDALALKLENPTFAGFVEFFSFGDFFGVAEHCMGIRSAEYSLYRFVRLNAMQDCFSPTESSQTLE